MHTQMKAHTIDQVLDHLDKIIKDAEDTKSRGGYFAALYRKVTLAGDRRERI